MPLDLQLEQYDLNYYVREKLFTQAEIDQLNQTTCIYLSHHILRSYVKQKKISLAQIKALTSNEFARLTSDVTHYLIKQNTLSVDECIMLNTRRAVVLNAPNVMLMIPLFLLSPAKALTLDNTFEFLDENLQLKKEVFDKKCTPQLAIEVDIFYELCTWNFAITQLFQNINEDIAEMGLTLSLSPQTATECCALLYLSSQFTETVKEHRSRLIRSSPKAVLDYVYTHPVFIARSFDINAQQLMIDSSGYQDYCLSIIKLSFRFFQSTTLTNTDNHASPTDSEQNKNQRLKAVGHHLLAMWKPNYPKLNAEKTALSAPEVYTHWK